MALTISSRTNTNAPAASARPTTISTHFVSSLSDDRRRGASGNSSSHDDEDDSRCRTGRSSISVSSIVSETSVSASAISNLRRNTSFVSTAASDRRDLVGVSSDFPCVVRIEADVCDFPAGMLAEDADFAVRIVPDFVGIESDERDFCTGIVAAFRAGCFVETAGVSFGVVTGRKGTVSVNEISCVLRDNGLSSTSNVNGLSSIGSNTIDELSLDNLITSPECNRCVCIGPDPPIVNVFSAYARIVQTPSTRRI